MKLVIQRVKHANVVIEKKEYSSINTGYMILVGSEEGDSQADVDYLAHKVANLRIFEDEQGKMNLNIKQVNGSILSVSQFTLLADMTHGNRPTFKKAGDPVTAKKMYEAFNQALLAEGLAVKTGVFGADMDINLENHGPATFELNHREQ
ncbi:D-tyrosyl-tRNA(Tyr) deacylase [Fructilactobacillus lindneri]|uniref:D-aminoacyl-tRNA deacylase n=2 Tax=Fructilactobacillus lindneri TaxID=53444 RepID=A0A0R2JP56_9LACO|nr:D-aminoacyl-tRNA deacylase [Fructilactobacillus lindneri]ANZ58124.1 D-tyrosyl-tRNA(Tyr) deacylase [Fructilactobacillus lindneri]ANZ59445.1 D-tyrosyl-tRNA(Tyr) deacylase [Fructilactobacillus lindneri]KRN78942.1 D-tyrosyl-tRNA(Tyr) deacylase [Fructilactobacillus lindneri DSM 20690 = JCM 11027]POG98771.1 D-tyrosyl-tRNA(Tyr) deacylase [Fructilactobacillus lindneri]POH03044.1 D-tyrosyl-tRNA(Tyr) deacylase [Fructilactobacillus lindneri]